MILAIHLHAVFTLNVVISMDLLHVHVYLHISDLLQTVVLNVQSTLNVPVTKRAYKKNVGILVLDLVVSMQSVL